MRLIGLLGLFATSRRRRRTWVEKLTSDGVGEIAAVQMAWAAFPFSDAHRPRSREFARMVRSESRAYLRSAGGAGYEDRHRLALRALTRWASLAAEHAEPAYMMGYSSLAKGLPVGDDLL